MIEVKDEILNGEPKYRLRDENGDIIYDNISVEMTTPVVEEGTPLNKALFDSIGNDLLTRIPKGLICMWSGTTIPTGWYLCDGTNGTPDLRDKFIVGVGNEYTIGDTGGEKQHTLTISEMPSHTHNVSIQIKGTSAGSTYDQPCSAGNNDASTYTVTSESTGGGQPFDNRPPYYALAFIMKA